MARLFRAFIFKLRKDWTFRITLIIGVGLAIIMSALYLIMEKITNDGVPAGSKMAILTGEGMLYSSLSPAQNFGIAIPVNLITFTVLEFTQGSIRNKIITGNSKLKIYSSLVLSGLVFAYALLLVYVGLCVGIGSIANGFDPNRIYVLSFGLKFTPEFLLRIVLCSLLCYASIVSLTIFLATLIRGIGGTIPIVIVLILMLYFSGMIIGLMGDEISGIKAFKDFFMWANPLYAISVTSGDDAGCFVMKDQVFIASIVSNLTWAALFFGLGSLIFVKRDVK